MALKDIPKELVLYLENRPEVLFALVYGSAVEGEHFRDLDIGLFLDRERVSASADLDYAFELADELECMVPYPVDVRVINDAPLPFRYNVSQGVVLVANDQETLACFRERTWDEFFDFRPVAMQYLKEMR